MRKDRLSAWMTGEAVVRILAAQRSAQESWDPLQRLANTFGDVDDDTFRALVMKIGKAIVELDHYFALLIAEARRRGIG